MLVPAAAGSALDSVARTVAARLSLQLGHAVLIENQSDAARAFADAAHAPPDGHTLLLAGDRLLAELALQHAPDYELISVPGRVMSLDRYLALMAQDVFYAGWELGPIRVHVGQDQAALRYPARITFPSGKVVDCWHTDIYALRSGRWQAVWSQATQRAPDAPPASGADAP
mgnify:CR=1 FL=1